MLYLRISDLTESLSCLLLSTLRLRAIAMFGGMQRIYSFLQVCRSCYTDLQCIISTLSSINIILLFIAFLLYSRRTFVCPLWIEFNSYLSAVFCNVFTIFFQCQCRVLKRYYEATFHFIIMLSHNKMQLLSFPVSRKIQKRFSLDCVSLLSEHFCVDSHQNN